MVTLENFILVEKILTVFILSFTSIINFVRHPFGLNVFIAILVIKSWHLNLATKYSIYKYLEKDVKGINRF